MRGEPARRPAAEPESRRPTAGRLAQSIPDRRPQTLARQALIQTLRRPAALATAPVQRLTDADGEVTLDRIANETDVSKLKAWLQEAKADWMDAELLEPLRERIAALTPAIVVPVDPKTVVKTRITEFATVALHVLASFFSVCEGASLDPATVVEELVSAKSSNTAFKRALTYFADGATLAAAKLLAAEHQGLMDLRMDTITADIVAEKKAAGLLSVSKATYSDTPLKAGSVYEFHIVGTVDRVLPEWHVHWASGNNVSAASFKNERHKVGPGARRTTGSGENSVMKTTVGSLWGP